MSYSPFEPELRAFTNQPAPQYGTVFYGSSSIRLWENLERDFPGRTIVNRGFGGATLRECVDIIPRIILPLTPTALVLYAADNDLDQGASPEHVAWLFGEFMGRIREALPVMPVAYVSVKPSPSRFWNIAKIWHANSLVESAIPSYGGASYLDVFAPMLSPTGGSRPELFTDDGLHMNASGYALWTGVIGSWLAATLPLTEPSTT